MTDQINFDLKRYEDITIAEWLFYTWIDVRCLGEPEPLYIKGHRRPFDESIRLAGTLQDLKSYMGNE